MQCLFVYGDQLFAYYVDIERLSEIFAPCADFASEFVILQVSGQSDG